MTRIPVPVGTFARPSRGPQLTFVMTAVAVLALGACGSKKADAGGERAKSAVTAGGQSDAAFTEMLDHAAQSCPPSAPPEAPPTEPAETLPGSVEADVEPIAPTAGPEVELNARDWCASARHEERIAQALWNLKGPTPAKVRTILHDLGYVDDRIHDLRQTGASTRFFLDLRDKGGRLCLEGSAAGERTVIDPCVAPATGPFTPGGPKGDQEGR
ncbi:hypothetical protein ABZ837_42105 [Streptomyces sp. NPDC047197]|uniref:hypothetical protein n=1 Tax=Streptomyces sp. NPDC047197 TaxID=3155477 RepID=UPI0033E4E9CC